jgi:site-specific recombinase XerD
MVKALLNHAMHDQSHLIKDDTAWRLVKPFKSVGKPRSIRYTDEEVDKIINSAPDRSTANLIEAAFLTGARYGELINSFVYSVDIPNGTWTVNGKTGSRPIKLHEPAVKFFARLVNGKSANDYLFTMENGSRWKPSDQTRKFKAALEKARLPDDGSMYALRHSYISTSIEGGIPLNLIAENCGTSVRMIEQKYSHVLVEKKRAFFEAGAPSLPSRIAH